MKKYLIGRSVTSINCDNCSIVCLKPNSEIIRNKSLNKKLFCSRSCACSYGNKMSVGKLRNRNNISLYCKNRIDGLTYFRYYLKSAKNKYKELNITIYDLKNQWEKQNGICPYTNLQLELRSTSKPVDNKFIQASLDRIDSSKGYIVDNIQFISMPINFLKGQMSNEETIKYLKLITNNISLVS